MITVNRDTDERETMNYIISIIESVQTGEMIALNASGNKRYITLRNKENGETFISKHFDRNTAEELFWKVGRNVAENMYGWNRWVEMLEA